METEARGVKLPMGIQEILSLLPHRYPFILVDRVVEAEPGKRLVAIKNVTMNEPFFPGHFPQMPVMPGVLIVEALAQACGLLAFVSADDPAQAGRTVLLMGVDKARFRRKVEPGDQLRLICEIESRRHGVWKFTCTAEVDGARAATAEIMATLG